MKKQLLILLLIIIALQACKKDDSSPVKSPDDTVTLPTEPIQIPADPLDVTPVSGELLQPSSPNSNIISRKLNMTLGYNKHLYLDVNADGTTDFSFVSVLISQDGKGYLYLLVNPKTGTGNKIILLNGPEQVIYAGWAVPFEKDQLIQPTTANQGAWSEPLQKTFIVGISRTENTYECNGLWRNKTDKYMGFKFNSNGKTYYGWVRLSHNAAKDEITVSDYAYKTVADQGIKAGEQ